MVHVNVGDSVTVTTRTYDRAGSDYRRVDITDRINESGDLRVTRVYADTLIIRGPILPDGSVGSFIAWKHDILTRNGRDARTGERPVVPRKLGTKPEDTPELTHIGTDHPGIQWLFQDMAQFADNKGWCSTYDDLAIELGIPPREHEYDVSHTHNGIMVYATIRAVNEETAQEKLIEMFA